MPDKFVFKDYEHLLLFVKFGLLKSRTKAIFAGDDKLSATRRFFTMVGNPQDELRAIHIAGTSGKGTIAYLTESILRAAGKSTGLLISPHVYDLRERAQIDGDLASRQDYLMAANSLLPGLLQSYINSEQQTFYKFNTALAFKLFATKKVEYAVIETGLGGMYDSTNTLQRSDKICVLSRIGKDHTQILGNTYKEIATQKAGIVHAGNQVFALRQNLAINQAFQERADMVGASLQMINGINTSLKEELGVKRWAELNRQLVGDFQNENVQLAVAATRAVAARDGWKLTLDHIRQGIENFYIPGRFEEHSIAGRHIIFDGAHNEQKASGLVSAMLKFFPNKKWCIIIAMKKGKFPTGLLRIFKPIANSFIVTSFNATDQDMDDECLSPQTIANKLQRNFTGKISVTDNATEAVKEALAQKSPILVTGSFYLLKNAKDAFTDLTR